MTDGAWIQLSNVPCLLNCVWPPLLPRALESRPLRASSSLSPSLHPISPLLQSSIIGHQITLLVGFLSFSSSASIELLKKSCVFGCDDYRWIPFINVLLRGLSPSLLPWRLFCRSCIYLVVSDLREQSLCSSTLVSPETIGVTIIPSLLTLFEGHLNQLGKGYYGHCLFVFHRCSCEVMTF